MIDLVRNIKSFGVISKRENKMATRSGLTKTVRERQDTLLLTVKDEPMHSLDIAKATGEKKDSVLRDIVSLLARGKLENFSVSGYAYFVKSA